MIKVLLEQGEIVVEHLLHGPNVGVNKKHLLHKLMVDGFHFSVSHFDLWTNQTENQQRNISIKLYYKPNGHNRLSHIISSISELQGTFFRIDHAWIRP